MSDSVDNLVDNFDQKIIPRREANFREINAELQKLFDIEVIARVNLKQQLDHPIVLRDCPSKYEIRVQLFNGGFFTSNTYKYSVECQSPLESDDTIYVWYETSKDIHQFFAMDGNKCISYYLDLIINTATFMRYLSYKNMNYTKSTNPTNSTNIDNDNEIEDNDWKNHVRYLDECEKIANSNYCDVYKTISMQTSVKWELKMQYIIRIAEIFTQHHHDRKILKVIKMSPIPVRIVKDSYKGYFRSSYQYSCVIPTPIKGYPEVRCITDWMSIDVDVDDITFSMYDVINMMVDMFRMQQKDLVVSFVDCLYTKMLPERSSLIMFYVKDCVVKAQSNLDEKKKCMDEVKKLHTSLQKTYNILAKTLIDSAVKDPDTIVSINKKSLAKTYPVVQCTPSEPMTFIEKYILPQKYTYSFVADSSIGGIDIKGTVSVSGCPSDKLFNKYGVNTEFPDSLYGFQLDQSYIIDYLNLKNVKYEIFED